MSAYLYSNDLGGEQVIRIKGNQAEKKEYRTFNIERSTRKEKDGKGN
jgi:hypothetical protein